MLNRETNKFYVYILDYGTGTIKAFETNDIENIEMQLLEQGYKESQYLWMVTSELLEIEWLER